MTDRRTGWLILLIFILAVICIIGTILSVSGLITKVFFRPSPRGIEVPDLVILKSETGFASVIRPADQPMALICRGNFLVGNVGDQPGTLTKVYLKLKMNQGEAQTVEVIDAPIQVDDAGGKITIQAWHTSIPAETIYQQAKSLSDLAHLEGGRLPVNIPEHTQAALAVDVYIQPSQELSELPTYTISLESPQSTSAPSNPITCPVPSGQ